MGEDAEFIREPRLAGCKFGVTFDGRQIMVSPAFYSLLADAETEAERQALVRSLKVLDTRLAVTDVLSAHRFARWRRAMAEISRSLTRTAAT